MKVNLACHVDVLRAKNHPNIAIQFAEAFASLKIDTELVVPYIFRQDNIKRKDIFSSYGLEYKFKITFLKTLLFRNSPIRLRYFLLLLFHAFRASKLLIKHILHLEREKRIVIATYNDILIPYILISKIFFLRNLKSLVWEHEFHRRKRDHWIYKNCSGIIATNSAIKKDLNREFGIPLYKIILSFNPVSERRLNFKYDKSEIRRKLNQNINAKVVVYTGKVGIGIKEVEYIIEAASLLPDFVFILTGGTPKVIKYYKQILNEKAMKNVVLTGFLPQYNDIKYYQCAADVLVSYYSKYDINVKYNLPAKICEYMSTKNPIVSCDFPALRDLLHMDNALLVEAEDPKALAVGIKKLIEDKKLSYYLANNAFNKVREITFENIARKIIDFVNTL